MRPPHHAAYARFVRQRPVSQREGTLTRPKLRATSTGIAGEYLVAAELTRRAYIATLTLKNTRSVDILAASSDGKRQVAIQVKTKQVAGDKWMLSASAEVLQSPTLFYVFVALHDTQPPEFHIVPSSHVAKYVRERHETWLRTPG